MNKLGDRRYIEKDLRGALQHYKEALRIRQDSCKGAKSVSAEVQLGIVTSLLKVVDIEQVTCDHLNACALTASAVGYSQIVTLKTAVLAEGYPNTDYDSVPDIWQ